MMRKIFVVIAVVLAFGLAACGVAQDERVPFQASYLSNMGTGEPLYQAELEAREAVWALHYEETDWWNDTRYSDAVVTDYRYDPWPDDRWTVTVEFQTASSALSHIVDHVRPDGTIVFRPLRIGGPADDAITTWTVEIVLHDFAFNTLHVEFID